MKKRLGCILLAGVMLILAGCQKTEDKNTAVSDVPMEQIHTAVKEAYGEDYVPNMSYDDEALQNIVGIDPALCEEYIAEAPMISMQVDTFIGIKAKSGKIEDVKKALESYRETLINDTMQYPMNQIKIQASKVVSYGDYAFFIMLGFIAPEEEEQEEAEVLKAYEAQSQKAVDVIEGLLLKE